MDLQTIHITMSDITYIVIIIFLYFSNLVHRKKVKSLLSIVNDINKMSEITHKTMIEFVRQYENTFIVTTSKPVTDDDIRRITHYLESERVNERISNSLKKDVSFYTLICDVCTHRWERLKPNTDRVTCPHCHNKVEYEIEE